jgi:hypothetical protein
LMNLMRSDHPSVWRIHPTNTYQPTVYARQQMSRANIF